MDQKELGFAAVDTGRERRQGFAEVIYGAGKTAEQIVEILKILLAESEGNVMATRVDREKALTVLAALPEVRYDEVSRILCVERKPPVEEELLAANVVIVVAGMEGALASVVGGLVARPVIAVPTSVGYGASFHGLTALLSMLNSCATGVAVVNIDNGFGAGAMASRINEEVK